MTKEQKLIKKIIMNGESFISLVAVYEMLDHSQERIDKFLKVLWKSNSQLNKFYFLNSRESVVLFEKVLEDEGVNFDFQQRFWGNWGFLRRVDPKKYRGLRKMLKRITKISWDEIEFFGFFQLEKELVNGGPGRFTAYRLQASDKSSLVENKRVSKYFYCHLSKYYLNKDTLNNNSKYPRKSESYPHFQARKNINGYVYLSEDQLLKVLAKLNFHDVKLINESDFIYEDAQQVFPEPLFYNIKNLSKYVTLENSLKLNGVLKEQCLRLINHINNTAPLPEGELLELKHKISASKFAEILGAKNKQNNNGLCERYVNEIFSSINKIKSPSN